MRIQNLSPLFLIILLLSSVAFIPISRADPTVVYQFLEWNSNFLTDEVDQSDITGTPPTQIANINYQPGGNTIGMQNVHGFNGTDYGFFYRFFFAIDYNTLNILFGGPSQNTTIFNPSSGTTIQSLAYNTSVTHVSNNVFLMGMKGTNPATTVQFDSAFAVGSHTALGISDGATGCFEFTTLQGDIFHEFVVQAKNDTTAQNAMELFVDGNYWCTFSFATANDMDRATLGHSQDQGTGSATGFLISRYREYLVTGGRSSESLRLAGLGGAPPIEAPPDPFGEGNQSTFMIMTAEDARGNLRDQYAAGETIIFDTSLQFINDTSGLVQDAPIGEIINFFRFDEFFDSFSFIGQAPLLNIEGKGPRARLPYVHIDGLMPTTDFRANYTGNNFQNLTSAISNVRRIITIEDAEIPLSIGTRLSPPSVEGLTVGQNFIGPLLASDIQRQELFSHGDFFRVSTFLTRIDTGGGLVDQIVFLELQINATGPFIRLETITTNDVGRATSQFRTWDTRFIGAQVFRFRYFASAPFINSTSALTTVFVSSQASDFRLTLEIIPSTVRPGDRIELRGQLTNIGSSSIGIPLSNRKIEIFVSSFDKTGFFNLQVTQNLALNIRTNDQGFYSHIIFGPNIGGVGIETMDFFANSTINNIVAISPNATLTITVSTPPPIEIADVVPPNFFVFNALIDNPQANCQFPDPKICSTMLWMVIVFLVSSVLAMMAGGLKIPGTLIGLGWLFMMLGGMIIGVFVQAVLEVLLFIGALPVVVVLFITIGAILRGGSPAVTTA